MTAACPPPCSKQERTSCEDDSRCRYLRDAEAENITRHYPQSLERQLKANREEHEDNSQLRKPMGAFELAYQRQAMRANGHSSDKIADYRTDAEASKQRDDGYCSKKEDNRVPQKRIILGRRFRHHLDHSTREASATPDQPTSGMCAALPYWVNRGRQ